MQFKYFLSLVVFSTLFSPSFVQAGEKEFAALFVRAHHDFADQGASAAIETLDQALNEAGNQASRDIANTFLFAILKSEGRTFSDDIMNAKYSVQLLNRAIQMRPNDPFVHMHLGKAYCTLQQNQKCLSSLTDAINVAKGEKKARYYSARANSYTLHLNRPNLALQDRIAARHIYQQFGKTKMANHEDRMIKLQNGEINVTELLRNTP